MINKTFLLTLTFVSKQWDVRSISTNIIPFQNCGVLECVTTVLICGVGLKTKARWLAQHWTMDSVEKHCPIVWTSLSNIFLGVHGSRLAGPIDSIVCEDSENVKITYRGLGTQKATGGIGRVLVSNSLKQGGSLVKVSTVRHDSRDTHVATATDRNMQRVIVTRLAMRQNWREVNNIEPHA